VPRQSYTATFLHAYHEFYNFDRLPNLLSGSVHQRVEWIIPKLKKSSSTSRSNQSKRC
jgi:hypothetical protein